MPDSRIESASSFGVRCRSAPSTSAIMRSRKVEPDADVTLTLIRSETTLVPPVTAERSPPASRMTGADSPVTADFVDHGDAFDDLAVGRNEVAGLDQHDVADVELIRRHVLVGHLDDAGHREALGHRRRCACRARSSACALPRPSATASAKLANSTVNHSQAAIWPEKAGSPEPVSSSRRKIARDDRRHHLGDEDHRIADRACADRA